MSNVNACPHPNLSQEHYDELLLSGLNDDTIKARGYFTISDRDGLSFAVDAGKATANQLGAGLGIPIYAANSKMRQQASFYQMKLDTPRKEDGHTIKYESPAGRPQLIDVGWRSMPTTANIIITEGIKKADALRQTFPDALVIGLQSVSGGLSPARKPKQLRVDIKEVLTNRESATIYLCFDSDMLTNANVWLGVDRYRALLTSQGYKVKVVVLPTIGEQKIGADDLLYQKGADALKFTFEMAHEEMPPKPVASNGKKRDSADEEQAKKALETYKAMLEIDSASLSDRYATDIWLGKHNGDIGQRVPSMKECLLFDYQTGYGYRFNDDNKTYAFQPEVAGHTQINNWFGDLVNTGLILARPLDDDFGPDGQDAKSKAEIARLKAVTSVTSITKARNVYATLKGDENINHTTFNTEEHNHLFPLAGGKAIDFRQPECQLVDTPVEARFTWCSAVSAEEYEQAWHAYHEKGERPKRWRQFIEDISQGCPTFKVALSSILGYMLHGRRRHLFFIFHGNGRNGKGVILRFIAFLLGNNDDELSSGSACHEIDAKAFVGKDTRHDQHWGMHKNRRLIVAEDARGYVNESRILRYAGGDSIESELKGGANYTFKPTGALIFAGQGDRIQFKLSDDAIRDRLLALTFTKQFLGNDQDMELEGDLKKEAPLILVELSQYAHRYHISETLEEYDYMVECRNDVMRLGNTVFDFMDNQNVYVPTDDKELVVSVPNFLAHYKRHCEDYGLQSIDNRNGDVIKALQSIVPHAKTRRQRMDETNNGDNRWQMIEGLAFANHIDPYSSLTALDGNIGKEYSNNEGY